MLDAGFVFVVLIDAGKDYDFHGKHLKLSGCFLSNDFTISSSSSSRSKTFSGNSPLRKSLSFIFVCLQHLPVQKATFYWYLSSIKHLQFINFLTHTCLSLKLIFSFSKSEFKIKCLHSLFGGINFLSDIWNFAEMSF